LVTAITEAVFARALSGRPAQRKAASRSRAQSLSWTERLFVGMGVSGGEEGALEGPSIMPGGAKAAWERIAAMIGDQSVGLLGRAIVYGDAEAFARRVDKEGLPVARLWETHSALVSIGLNPKGKPGLWLIQKTH
jgi:6-phosphogluconate dehydrogenase